MLQGLWSTWQDMLLFSYLDMSRSIKLLCSVFVNCETEDCNRKFLLEMEYGEKLGYVTGVRRFCIRTYISLQIFGLPEIKSESWCCMLDMIISRS